MNKMTAGAKVDKLLFSPLWCGLCVNYASERESNALCYDITMYVKEVNCAPARLGVWGGGAVVFRYGTKHLARRGASAE